MGGDDDIFSSVKSPTEVPPPVKTSDPMDMGLGGISFESSHPHPPPEPKPNANDPFGIFGL